MEVSIKSEGYDSWSLHMNYDYAESFCHYSGEKSFGKTSFSKPVLYAHYKKATELQLKIHEHHKTRR